MANANGTKANKVEMAKAGRATTEIFRVFWSQSLVLSEV